MYYALFSHNILKFNTPGCESVKQYERVLMYSSFMSIAHVKTCFKCRTMKIEQSFDILSFNYKSTISSV